MIDKNYINKLKQYAIDNDVPIIEDNGLEILLKLIKEENPTSILEIGTAIGYSASMMTTVTKAPIITFERNEKMLKEAEENINSANLENQISIIDADFLSYNIKELPMFDFIYIDGAKAQYYNFFKHIEPNLSENGIVVFDNLKFHGYVHNKELTSQAGRNLKQLIRKIEKFLENIENEKGYDFQYIDIGDGIGVLRREINE